MGIVIYLAISGLLVVSVGVAGLIWTMTHPPRKTLADALARGWPADPGELGLRFEELRVTFDDGTQTSAWEIEGEDPQGPVVVVTHGWASSKHQALRHVPTVIQHAWQVVVYDLRGHGESTAKVCPMGFEEHKDLQEIVGRVAPGRAVVLLGSSMGAGISIVAGAEAAGQVAGVIVEGPYRVPMEPVGGQLQVRGLPKIPFIWLAGAYFRWRYRQAYEDFDRAHHAGRLTCPLLVLHGEDDPICSVASGRAIAQAAPQGEWVTFEGAGHGRLAEHDPPKYQMAVDGFFKRVAVGAGPIQQSEEATKEHDDGPTMSSHSTPQLGVSERKGGS